MVHVAHIRFSRRYTYDSTIPRVSPPRGFEHVEGRSDGYLGETVVGRNIDC